MQKQSVAFFFDLFHEIATLSGYKNLQMMHMPEGNKKSAKLYGWVICEISQQPWLKPRSWLARLKQQDNSF